MENGKKHHAAVEETDTLDATSPERYLRLFPDYDPTPAPRLVSDAYVAAMRAYTEERKKITPEQWAAEIRAISEKYYAQEKTAFAH